MLGSWLDEFADATANGKGVSNKYEVPGDRTITCYEFAREYVIEYAMTDGKTLLHKCKVMAPTTSGTGPFSIHAVEAALETAVGEIMNVIGADETRFPEGMPMVMRKARWDMAAHLIHTGLVAWFKKTYHYKIIKILQRVAPYALTHGDKATLRRAESLGFVIP